VRLREDLVDQLLLRLVGRWRGGGGGGVGDGAGRRPGEGDA
jgi:hypothetical protein